MKAHFPSLSLFTLLPILSATSLCAQTTATWIGNDASFSNFNNWDSMLVPSAIDIAQFGLTSGSTTINLSGGVSIAGLNFTANAVSYTFGTNGQTVVLGASGIANSSTVLQTLLGSYSAATSQTWFTAAGGLTHFTASGAISIHGSQVLTIDGAGDTTFSGIVSGTGGSLNKIGSGTLTLSGANTYTGATSISAGTLTLSNVNALGGPGGAVNVLTGGTLAAGAANLGFNRAVTVDGTGSLLATTGFFEFGSAGTGSIAVTNGGTINATASIGLGVAGIGTGSVSGAGSMLNTGTLFLGAFGGTGTFSVGTGGIVTASRVRFGVGGGAGTLNLNSGGTLRTGGTDGLLIAEGGGTLNLAGGTLQVIGSALTTAVPATLAAATTSTVDTAGLAATLSGVLSGSGSFVKTGTGTLTLSGANTYSGDTTVNAGTLATPGEFSANAAVIVSGPTAALTSGGNLQIGQNGTGTLAVTGGGSVTSAGLLYLGNGIGGTASAGTASVTGTGSTLTVGTGGTGTLQLGYFGAGTLTVGSGGTVAAGNLIFAAAPGYSGTLNLNSGGTLALGGVNGLRNDGTAAFNFSGGTLRVAGSALTSSVPATLAAATTSTVDTAGLAATLSGVLSGSGALVKTGVGLLTLTGANTYTGGTTVTGGLLAFPSFAPFGTGTVSLDGGGLQWATGVTTDVSASARFNRTLGSSGGIFDTNGNKVTLASALSGSGGLTKSGAGTLSLTATTNTYTGGTTVTGGILSVTNEARLGPGNLAITGGTLASAQNFAIASRTATVSGAGATLAVGDLNGGNQSLYVGYFGGAATLDIASGGNVSAPQIVFNPGVGTINVNPGGTLTVGYYLGNSGNLNLAGGTLRFTTSNPNILASFALTNASTIDTNGTDIQMGINGSSGLFSGTGSLTKAGTGTLTLYGANTYTGATIVSGGTLALGHNNTLPDASAVTVNSGATLNFGSLSDTVGSLAGAGSVILGSGTVPIGADQTSTTFSGDLSGTGRLTKIGSGTLTLTGASTHSGGTTVSTGLVNFNSLANFGTGTVSLAGGGLQWATGTTTDVSPRLADLGGGGSTFDTNGNSVTLATALTGSGRLIKTGAGTLALTSGNTYIGGTTVLAGTLQIGDGTASGSIIGTISNSATVAFNRSDDYSYNGTITGTGGLENNGPTLRLATAQTYTGPTNLNSGSLILPSSSNQFLSAATKVNIASGASLNLSGQTNLTIAGLTGTGQVLSIGNSRLTLNIAANDTSLFAGVFFSRRLALTKSGAGTLTLVGANTNADSTTIVSAGTLQIGDGGTTGSLPTNIVNNATLAFNRSDGSSYSGIISGTGELIKLGPDGITLTGASTYTGPTTISAGTLNFGTDNVLPSTSAVSVNSGANLNFSNFSGTIGSLAGAGRVISLSGSSIVTTGADHTSTTFTGVISGPGSLIKVGTGTFTLTGINPYTGPTTVAAGTLLNNGSIVGPLTVNSDATLGGSGTIVGLTTITSGGILAPGNSPGTLTFTNGLNLDTGSILNFDLGTAAADLIRVSGGTLTGPSGQMIVNLFDSGSFTAGTYRLIDATGATLSNIGTSSFSLGSTISGYDYAFGQSGNSFNITATVIPEPSTFAVLLLSSLGLLFRRERQGIW